MKRALVTGALVALAVAPQGAVAKPSSGDRQTASQECRAERGTTGATREAFKIRYGTNKGRRNAFGKCVSRRARIEERQRQKAVTNAAKECQAERAANPTAFAIKYGTTPKVAYGRPGNAFGKCVSAKATAKKQAAQVADARRIVQRTNAARACAAERRTSGRADFGSKYGTVKSKRRNAFGRCVSQKAKAPARS